MKADRAHGKALVSWMTVLVVILCLAVSGAIMLAPRLRAADRADVKIAVFANAGVWPYNTTTVTDDLDYLGYTNYDLYTPADVADLFNDLEPVEGNQPLYGYDILIFSSGVWSGTSDSNYQLFESHKDVIDYAVGNNGMGLLAFEVSLMAGYNYKCLPDNLMIETVGPLYYIDDVSSYLNNDLTEYAFDELVLQPNDLSTYTGTAETDDVFRTDDMVGSFWVTGPPYPNGDLNGYETFVRGDYHGQQARITIAKEYGGGKCILSVAEYDYNCGDNPKTYYAQRLPVENMMEWLTPVAPPPVLDVKKTSDVTGKVCPGDTIGYVVTATNSGAGPSSSAEITDTYSVQVTYVSGSTTMNGEAVPDGAGGECPFTGGMEVHSPGAAPGVIAPSSSLEVRYRVTVNENAAEGSSVVNKVMLSADAVEDSYSSVVNAVGPPPAPESPAWYLAEGYTAGSFDTYILTQNPGDSDADVRVTFMRPDGTTEEVTHTVPAHSRYTVRADDVPGCEATELSTEVESTSGTKIICERAMYFDYNGYQGGSATVGVTSTSTDWYFAEGYTGGSFDTFILVQNPTGGEADVTFSFMKDDGTEVLHGFTVPGRSRRTLRVDDVEGLEASEFSTHVCSANQVGVVAERSMYFDYYGKRGGHASIGVPAVSGSWFLPEGYTAQGFDTYVLLLNPGGEDAEVTASFMKPFGEFEEVSLTVPAHSRKTIKVDDVPGCEATDVSTVITSTNGVGVMAERAMYFDYYGRRGGHASLGIAGDDLPWLTADEDPPVWYLAEGYTGGSFDTYVLLVNPSGSTANVEVAFMKGDGGTVVREYDIAARSRFTVDMRKIEELSDSDVSTSIESLNGAWVFPERAMYFDYYGLEGGHDSIGATGE